MALNSASLDLFCQQFPESEYEKTFALLFPREFLKCRYEDYLVENNVSDFKRVPENDWEYLISADWFDEQGQCEVAELIRLCIEWDLQPPSERLRELAEGIRNEQFGYWRWTLRRMGDDVLAEIEKVFAKYRV